MEGKCTLYTKIIYKGGLLVYKFTVYSLFLGHLIYHFHETEEMFFAVSLGHLNELDWDHQFEDIMIEIISQNVEIAINQFIGDK